MGYQPPARAFGVALDIEDEALRQALVAAIDGRSGLRLIDAYDDATSVIVTDRPLSAPRFAPMLTIGEPGAVSDPAENFVFADDVDVALAAAQLVAAGYLVMPAPERSGFGAEPPGLQAAVSLTPREREVLEFLVAGAPNKMIARALGISVHTAKFHVTAVIDKLHARNRYEAVAIALRSGLVAL